MEKTASAGDKSPQPVGCRWTTRAAGCGPECFPQPVEIARPPIHNHLSCPDTASPAWPVDGIWTTRRSPGCGRKIIAESVEDTRNLPGIRTAGAADRPAGPCRPCRRKAPEHPAEPVRPPPAATRHTRSAPRPRRGPAPASPAAGSRRTVPCHRPAVRCRISCVLRPSPQDGLPAVADRRTAGPMPAVRRGARRLLLLLHCRSRGPPSASWSGTGSGTEPGTGSPPPTPEGAQGGFPGAPSGTCGAVAGSPCRCRQPFLMRLVSSVTWL